MGSEMCIRDRCSLLTSVRASSFLPVAAQLRLKQARDEQKKRTKRVKGKEQPMICIMQLLLWIWNSEGSMPNSNQSVTPSKDQRA